MGVELYWDNDERTIMLLCFEGAWTWQELFETLGRAKQASQAAQRKIGAIIEVGRDMRFPGGSLLTPQGLENARKLLAMSDENTGPVVIAGTHPFIRAAFESIRRLHPQTTAQVRLFDTPEQARRDLQQRLGAASPVGG